MNTYDLKTVMTYAVSAHFQNGEEYKNYGSTTNKTIIQSHLGEIAQMHMCFVDHITQECADIADKIIQYYKGLTFKAMGAKINDFEQRVLAVIQSGVVDRRDIGVVASLPKAYFRAVKRDETDALMRKLSVSSIHIGTVGSDVEGKINVLNCSFIQRLQCYVVNAEMNGNIVCFFTKHDADNWGEGCTIKGKVKRHQTSKFHGGKETVLNYVKKVDKSV
jgi:putative lipoic acid-binding regulatory protein